MAVATTGMIADLVRQVAGQRFEVRQLMGPGVDPHLYRPTPNDAAALRRADVIFYNGHMLEGKMGEVFAGLRRQGRRVVALAETLPQEALLWSEEFEEHADPHLWMDVSLWARLPAVIARALAEADPQGAEFYEKNAAALEARLGQLHAWCLEMAASVPPSRRVLVTSHDAFSYFGRAYGFEVVALQGISTVMEASLADVSQLTELVRERGLPAIFLESSVNPAALENVARAAGVRIGGELFSDALGAAGELREGFDVGTYEGMIRYNMTTIVSALGGGQ